VTTAPTDNVPYAIASRDLNPIHRNQAISRIAGLPATIVHGMWTSANGMRVLQSALDHELGHTASSSSSFESQRMIKSFSAQFIGMVLPGDQIVTQVVHTGMHRPTGRRILTV
jgi:fatty acid synthase subunit beta